MHMHMQGVMAPCLSRSVLTGLLLLLCLAAPGQPGTLRDEETSAGKLANPFLSEDESHRLLQSYIVSILNEEDQGRPEINSREQEVFFLFHHHDYDRSGFLDGLEMIRLLSDYNAFHRPAGVYHYNQVVSLVDFLLQTQDLNHDGLFTPSELLSPPLLQTQQEEAVKDQNERAQNENEVEVQMERQSHQEPPAVEDGLVSVDDTQQVQVQTAEQTETIDAPVHQGQPEI